MGGRPAAVGLAMVLAACAPNVRRQEVAKLPTTAPVVTSGPTTPDPSALRMGARFETKEGNVVQVLSYVQPVAPKLLQPDSGMEFAAVEAEICAGPKGARRVTPERLALEMPNGTRQGRSFFGPKEPLLADARLAGLACVRGWVNYEVPEDGRPSYVVFEGSSVGRWAIDGGRA